MARLTSAVQLTTVQTHLCTPVVCIDHVTVALSADWPTSSPSTTTVTVLTKLKPVTILAGNTGIDKQLTRDDRPDPDVF